MSILGRGNRVGVRGMAFQILRVRNTLCRGSRDEGRKMRLGEGAGARLDGTLGAGAQMQVNCIPNSTCGFLARNWYDLVEG